MADPRVERLADVLVDYSTNVNAGELVQIRGSTATEPLLLALYERCLKKGAHALLQATPPHAEVLFYRHASDQHLEFVWESDRWLAEHIDVSLRVLGDVNTRQLSHADPSRQAAVARARRPLSDTFFKRTAEGTLRWSLSLYPTEAYAMDAQMSLPEYEDFFYAACLVDRDDPVAEWRRLGERNERVVDWLRGRREVHLEGEGTDLKLGISERTFITADGLFNMPDGEVFTGPIENATEGVVSFSYPVIYGGRSVEGVQLRFDGGRVVDAKASRNQDYLLQMLDADPGARTLGELGIGTNYGIADFSGEILLDEKIGGTIHLAVGASYPETGGRNQSSVHWDMVCDLRHGGRISVDGEPLMENGRLLVG